MELSDLYSEKILALASNPPKADRLAHPQASVRKVSRICGSSIEIDLTLENGVISGYGHTISACALGQTSAAIVSREIVGTPAVAFRALSAAFRAMLKDHAAPAFSGRWEDLRFLEPVRDYPARHASTLLVFEAVVEALDKLEGAQQNRESAESVTAAS